VKPASRNQQTPPPALTWTHLLASSSIYDCADGPQWFRALLREHNAGRPAAGSAASAEACAITWGTPGWGRHSCLPSNRKWEADKNVCPTIPVGHPFPELCAHPAGEHGMTVAINCRHFPGKALRQSGFKYLRHLAVLPNLRSARWLVPLDSPAVASAGLSLYTPSRTSAKLKRAAARAAMRVGLPIWYRDHIWIAQRELPPLELSLRSLFPGDDIRIALSSGAPEGARNRKASALAIAPDGRMLGFAKLARSPIARQIAGNEALVLQQLARIPAIAGAAPRLMFDGEVDGNRVMVQTPLAGHPAPLGTTPAHRRFLDALQSDERIPAAQTATVTGLPGRLRALPMPADDLLAIFDAVVPTLGEFKAPVTIIHGDFAPWNLRLHRGQLAAFDWEYGEPRGLPLLDEIHYRLQSGWLLEDWHTQAALQCLHDLCARRPLGLLPEQAQAIVIIYLLDAMARLLGEGYTDDQDVILWHRRLLDRLAPRAMAAREAVVV